MSLACLTPIAKAYRTAMLHLKLNSHVKAPNEKLEHRLSSKQESRQLQLAPLTKISIK